MKQNADTLTLELPLDLAVTPAAVAALFVRSDSCYLNLAGVDCWDVKRDARSYTGRSPVICHPPCRGWGRLRHWAKPRDDEKELAITAVAFVREFGGVLEHPYGSTLWPAAGLPPPQPGVVDAWGGWTLLVDQGWWGHPAPKPTYLYIVGVKREDLPEMPVQLQRAAGRTLQLSPADRERTPPAFAAFLVEIARMVSYVDLAARQLPAAGAVTPAAAVTRIQGDAAVTRGQVAPVTSIDRKAAVTPAGRALLVDGVQLPAPGRASSKRRSFKEFARSL